MLMYMFIDECMLIRTYTLHQFNLPFNNDLIQLSLLSEAHYFCPFRFQELCHKKAFILSTAVMYGSELLRMVQFSSLKL